MKVYFDHEKLDVYQQAINFCGWVGKFLGTISAKTAAKDQLDRASTSIPLNIAEGNGKFSPNDCARFFEIARGTRAGGMLREDETEYTREFEYEHDYE